jgi:hypothetical protein
MSLSPKDDPRSWLIPGPRAVKRPPIDARLLYYDITTNECALLRAMFELSPEGSRCWASLERYAEISGLDPRTIQYLLHGRNYIDKRPDGFIGPMNGRHVPGLIERHILIELAPMKKPSRRLHQWHTVPAIYSFNEAALSLKPEILARLEGGVQQTIPGIPRPPRPGEPMEVAPDHPEPRSGTTLNHVPDHPEPRSRTTLYHVPDHPEPRADDSRDVYSRTTNTKPVDSKAGGFGKTSFPPLENLSDIADVKDLDEIAHLMAKCVGLPESALNLKLVRLGLESEIRWAHCSPAEAASLICERASEDQGRGVAIDRFFFEDAKWRKPNANQRTRTELERDLEISAAMDRAREAG